MDTTEPPYENHNFRESETLEMPGEQSTFIKLKSEKCPEALSGRHGELQPVRRGFRCTRVEDVALCPWNIVTVALLEFYQRLLQVFSDVSSRPAPTAREMLHETAVAWIRYKLAQCVPARSWLETAQDFRARIKAVVAEINRTHDVDSLCRELPGRVQQVKAAEGGRINK